MNMYRVMSFLLLLGAAFGARADFAAPDFAYPKTVIGDADRVLNTTTSPGQGLTRFKAVMEIVTAKGALAQDSLYVMPSFISSVASREPDGDARGLMLLYEARTLSRIYGASRWRYNRVDAPLEPLPSNPDEWSGKQFEVRIKTLADSAIKVMRPYMTMPLGNYKEVVSVSGDSKTFYPLMRDFVYSQVCSMIDVKERPEYVKTVLGMTTKGTPEWAFWTCESLDDDGLVKAYNEYPNGVAGGYILWRIAEKHDRSKECVAMLRKYLADNRVNLMTGSLKSRLEILTRPSVNLTLPDITAPGAEIAAECEYSYTDEVTVRVYRDNAPASQKYPHSKTLVGTFKRKADKTVEKGKITIPIKIDKAGNYMVTVACPGVKESNGGHASVIVTPWMPVAVSQGKENVVLAASSLDGAPSQGVKVELLSPRNSAWATAGSTGADGFVAFATPKKFAGLYGPRPIRMSARAGSVYYGYRAGAGTYPEHTDKDKWTAGNVMVSRPVYHPGDTVGWSVVAVEKSYEPSKTELLKNTAVRAVLMDANYNPVDTLDVTTDAYGRANGVFAIPTDRLAGRFRITVAREKNQFASASVMVSDFKAPVFELRDVAVNRDGGSYVLTGRAVRYSGVGLADAEVSAELNHQWQFARYYQPATTEFPKLAGRTDAEGSFRIAVPLTAMEEGCYICNVTVTSLSADIATASASFRIGKPFMIIGREDELSINVDSPVKLDVYAVDAAMKRSKVDAKWELCVTDSTSATVASGKCSIDSLGLKVDWRDVPAGVYNLRVVPLDSLMFKPANIGKMTLYSIVRNDVPVEVALLVPETTFATAGNEVEVNVGLGAERHIYSVAFDSDGKPDVKVQKLSKGFHKLKFDFNGDAPRTVSLAAIADCKVTLHEITMMRTVPSRKMTLKGESWRDRVVPGTEEEWKIELRDSEGRGAAGAMVATMYNRALNSLSTLSWANLESLFMVPAHLPSRGVNYLHLGKEAVWNTARIRKVVTPGIIAPEFLFDGGVYYSSMMNVRRNAVNLRGSSPMMKEEVAICEDEACDAAPAMAAGSMKYAKQSMADGGVEEAAAETDAIDTEADAEKPDDSFVFRQSEVLQSFWMPTVEVDTAGTATLRFTVPNAIGGWTFRATAWTDDCRTAEMLANLVASKPVMVQPSLPRFLRQGDKARVLATVINNTDSAQRVFTVVEIFEPSTGKILGSSEHSDSLAAKGQALVGIEIAAPVDATAIGYRVKSSTGKFSDGEQSLIPILESSTMAIDSELFYLNDSEPSISVTIPADASGKGIVAVQYCQNPVWDAVKSLPGLYDFDPKTACAAASSAYAAMTANGLLKQFPEIREVLKIWQSDPTDSSLVSKLEKNEDIKLAVLSQTPFVGAANANTAQMQRLAMTFNEKDINRVLNTAVSALGRLQQPDGGFAWGAWTSESSPWITRAVLQTLGQANEAGHLPKDSKIDGIIGRAFSYLDKTADERDYGYTYAYSLFPGRKPSTLRGQKAVNTTIQDIVAGWKKSSTASKSVQALILHSFGNKAVAKEIMKSVAQFADVNGKRGVSFPSVRSVDSYCQMLYAFAKIMPDSTIIDGMRQWLSLQTQTTDALGSWNPTSLVSAILSTGSRWTALPTDATASVTIDGEPLGIGKVEAATGAFSERIEPSRKKRTVTFTRPKGGQVAYGSVVTVGKRPLSSIKGRGNDQLSIEKRLLVERNGKWVETTEFSLGERVRVQLKVKSSRTFEYVTINDDRPAAFEPVDQMPGWVAASTLRAYRENSDTHTRLFINWLPKGTYYLTYEMTAAVAGSFVSGVATVQSQYAPEMTARSGAGTIMVGK